jgi:hypothetical protein
MAEAGIDPFTIAEILGHKSIKMTARYSHATLNAKRRAVEALEAMRQKNGPQIVCLNIGSLTTSSRGLRATLKERLRTTLGSKKP